MRKAIVGRWVAIRLAGYGLTEKPPVELSHLPQLHVLDLSDNFIEFSFRGIGAAENFGGIEFVFDWVGSFGGGGGFGGYSDCVIDFVVE